MRTLQDDLVTTLRNTLPLIDAYRRMSGGDGDITASNIRFLLARVDVTKARTAAGYTGHNAVGGLQAHSTGDRFPWTIIVQGGGDAPYQYRAFNCNTEQRGPLRDTAAAAGDDVDFAISLSRGECGARPHPSWLVAFLKVHQPRTTGCSPALAAPYDGVQP